MLTHPWAHDHEILGYIAVNVNDLLIAGKRALLINAVQQVWKTKDPARLDCIP